MLVLPLKPAVRYELSSALASWLDSDAQVSFSPTNPLQFILPKPDFGSERCLDEFQRLQALRNCLSDCILKQASHKNAIEEGAIDDGHEYHAVLLEFEKQGFPTVDDDTTPLSITWKGAFSPQKETHSSLVWDRACVVFNIAALLTEKAAECERTDRAECKAGVGFCQQAASLLVILRELVASQQFSTVDLSNSMLIFWEKVLLAQAQSFIYRMFALNENPADPSKSHSTLSMLSQSTFDLFKEALAAAQDPRLESEIPRQATDWGSYCKAHSMLSASKASYHNSVTFRLEHAWGREIASLRDSAEKLKACRDFCKSLDSEGVVSYIKKECLAILPAVSDRLEEIDEDNYKTYHEEIPAKMPEIEGKQMCKLNPDLPQSMLIPKIELFTNR